MKRFLKMGVIPCILTLVVASIFSSIGVARAATLPTCGGWSIIPSLNGPGGFTEFMGAVALSPTNVWAVGNYADVQQNSNPLVEHWDGRSWGAALLSGVGNLDGLSAAAATSASDVWVVGSRGTALGLYTHTLIEHWDGKVWSIFASPNPGKQGNQLAGVAALSATDAWAVGFSGSPSMLHTLIEHWDGTSWSVLPSPNIGSSDQLNAVAVVKGTQQAWAVGSYYDTQSGLTRALMEYWDGHHWSIVPSSGPGALNGVTALSVSDVWAVGSSSPSSSSRTLVEHWNGTSWSTVPSPNPAKWPSSQLSGVAAISASDVWAVGSSANSSGSGSTLTEQWNGNRWTIVHSPNKGTLANVLNAVAAVGTGGQVWAVGAYGFSPSPNSPINTLTEFYC